VIFERENSHQIINLGGDHRSRPVTSFGKERRSEENLEGEKKDMKNTKQTQGL